jgi:hypothetical protein
VHEASAISVDDSLFEKITANNVQQAIKNLDALDPGLDDHQDILHNNLIAENTRGEQGTQGNLTSTTLASTVYQTETSLAQNILQVMRPNVARVTGKALNLGGLQIGSKDQLRLQVGGMDRDPLDIDLSSIIPTSNLNDIVEQINKTVALAANHYPIAAYNVDGKLVIAHNIPGEEYTVQVLSTVSQSAHEELGFSGLTSTIFNWADGNHAAYVGGKKITDAKPLLKARYFHSAGNLNEISPQAGDLVQLFGESTVQEAGILCNILNHSVTGSNINGTYYITGFLNANQTMVLNEDIPFGEFDIEITASSLGFNPVGRGQVYDIFLDNVLAEDGYDGYGVVTKSKALEYDTISGVNLVAVSKNFPTSGMQWSVTSNDEIKLIQSGDSGSTVEIPSGFQGQLRVYAPDNINSALVEVSGNVSSSTQNITPSAFAGTDDRLYLASVHYEGNFSTNIVKYITDRRKIGESSKDKLNKDDLNEALAGLRNNGVIRGFDVISSTSNSIKVRGGRALIDGKMVDVETQSITIDTFDNTARLLVLDINGNYITYGETPGFTFEELTAGDSYGDNREIATILEFGTTSSALDGTFIDRRLILGNIDKKIVDTEASFTARLNSVQSAVSGVQWGFTEAFTTDKVSEFLSSIHVLSNPGFSAVDAPGFSSGSNTTRRFEFIDPNSDAYSVFRPIGMTHLNVMAQVRYTDETGVVPFGNSGLSTIDIGVNVVSGVSNDGYSENYATAKTIQSTVFPANVVTEQYVASIPISTLSLQNNVIFDIVPRIRITGSEFINGGGIGSLPVIQFGKIRVITSSYSIAGSILNQDGESVPLAATVGDIL